MGDVGETEIIPREQQSCAVVLCHGIGEAVTRVELSRVAACIVFFVRDIATLASARAVSASFA